MLDDDRWWSAASSFAPSDAVRHQELREAGLLHLASPAFLAVLLRAWCPCP